MIDLEKAFVCINCEVIFNGVEYAECPKCTSTNIFKLTNWLPSITINSPRYVHMRLNSEAIEEITKELKKPGSSLPVGATFPK
ncbi:MAG TPA: hypothetical protein ENH31_02890 [Nitrospirae bacterium]|nr:hypothetical protein [Nitrospirota bacterium]HDK81499.1 hypothetical protein [Nitrospirota bacterium]